MSVSRPLCPTDTRVLIVEDSRDDAMIMARALQTFGARRPSIVSGVEPPFNPTVCLARVLARLLGEYQSGFSSMEGNEDAA